MVIQEFLRHRQQELSNPEIERNTSIDQRTAKSYRSRITGMLNKKVKKRSDFPDRLHLPS